ncbi:copper resistance protein CopC [Amycolatopsis sp. K13G38]|uniref:Copper resistance protein CopC n=1 Tax=Amycolatopsis acididurans TaxID=2724524 RepID=A0ABX1JCD7_9PSEU|nr:copper resistance protein CopC [Amycolatopsis acididurans]NKQ57452.1 copper resistance protein CopC [Amycolatopsis acididurans]
MTTLERRPRAKPAGPRARRFAAFALLVLACWGTLLAIAAPPSSDLPVLRTTSPGVDSTARPDNLVLTFDRPVSANLATVRLTDPYHRPIDPDRPVHANGRAETISVPLPKQKYAGTYSVAWSVPAGADVAANGTFTFDLASRSPVQDAPVLPARPSVVVTVAHGIAQFGALAAAAVLAGAALLAVFRPVGEGPMRRVATYAWFAAIGLTTAAFLTFGPYTAKLPLTEAFKTLAGTMDSGAGAVLLARLAVLALGGLAVAQLMTAGAAATARERWARAATVAGCAGALAVTWVFVAPIGGPARHTQAAPVRLMFDTGADKGLLDLAVTPGKIGDNEVHVSVLDTKDVAKDGLGVTVAFHPPDAAVPAVPVPLARAGTGYSTGSVRLPGPGQWELELTVESAGGKRETIYGVVDVPA